MMKNSLTLLGGILLFTIASISNNANAQIYDESLKICRSHPNMIYEQNWEITPTPLALARICISEGGWRLYNNVPHVPRNECIAIYNVFKTRNRYITSSYLNLQAMRAYSPKSFDYQRNDRVRYIPYLNEQGEMPIGWSYGGEERWNEAYRAVWLETLALAKQLIAGEINPPSPCNGIVHHWAANSPEMIERALGNGLRRVSCRDVKNIFWAL